MQGIIDIKKTKLLSYHNADIRQENDVIFLYRGTFWPPDKKNLPPPRRLLFPEMHDGIHPAHDWEGSFILLKLDGRRREVMVFSDFSGSIPFYYTISRNCLIFSSNLRHCIANNNNWEINLRALYLYLILGHIPAPLSIIKNVYKIKRDSILFIDAQGSPLSIACGIPQDSVVHKENDERKTADTIFGIIKNNIAKYCKNKKIAILSTGGFDSSLLISLSLDRKPRLFFNAFDNESCREYNNYSIKKCKEISDFFALRFDITAINRGEYLHSFPSLIRLMNEPIADEDLAGLYVFLSKLKGGDGLRILSGMGANQLEFSRAELSSASPEAQFFSGVDIHKRLFENFKTEFITPYLSRAIFNRYLSLPARLKKNRIILRRRARERKLLPRELSAQKTIHGDYFNAIIKDFLTTFSKVMAKDSFPIKGVAGSRALLFRKIIFNMWYWSHLKGRPCE